MFTRSYLSPGDHSRHNNGHPVYSIGMSVGALIFPPIPPVQLHGGLHGGFPPAFQGGPYHGPPCSLFCPPPPPGNHAVDPPALPLRNEGNLRSIGNPVPPPPPPMPNDPEMLKNIEVTSLFVVKNGPQFEHMARAKQAGDPKFAFLFGGDQGTDAALGFDFYNWKKQYLAWLEERSRAPPAVQQRVSEPNSKRQLGDVAQVEPAEKALSPEGSDMDMEDDFGPTDPSSDKDGSAAILATLGERKSGLSSTPAERRARLSSPATQKRPEMSTLVPDKKFSVLDSKLLESNMSSNWNVSSEREFAPQRANKGFSDQDSKLEVPALGGSTHGNSIRHVPDLGQKDAISLEVPRRRDTRRKTGFDRPRMEDISPQGSPTSVRVRQHTEPHPFHDLDRKGSFRNGQGGSTKPSRWGPDVSSDRLGKGASHFDKGYEMNAGKPLGLGQKRADSSSQIQGRETSLKDLQSADLVQKPGFSDTSGSKDHEKLVPKAGSDQPAIDEFGRLLRQGGSDSDVDDSHHGAGTKRRRVSSRSRSGSLSPSNTRFRRLSPGHSPHRRGRRSRSRSRSPRRNRSRSRSPPRDGRWGEGRVDRGGRRAGRSQTGQPSLCFDFVRGKCFRGSFCRYSHDESHGTMGDQSGRWIGGRGRDREQDRSGAPAEERDRNRGSRIVDDVKPRMESQFDVRANDEGPRNTNVTEVKQKAEIPAEDLSSQGKGSSTNSAHPSAIAESYSLVKSSEVSPKVKGLSTPLANPSFPPQASKPTRFPPAPKQQSVPSSLTSSHAPSSFIPNSGPGSHMLGNLLSPPVRDQHSFMVSPSQHLQHPPTVSQSQQPVFSMVPQLPKLPSQPSSSLQQSNGFTENVFSQQPAFSPALNVLSASPSLPTLASPFATSAGPPPSLLNASQPTPTFVTPQPPPIYKVSQPPPPFSVSPSPHSFSGSLPLPSMLSASQPPPSFTSAPPPSPFTSSQPSPSFPSSQPPPSFPSSQPPPSFSSSQPSPSFSSSQPPPSFLSSQPPPSFSSSQPSPSFSSSQPSPFFTSSQPPPSFNSSQPPLSFNSSQPPPSFNSSQPPPPTFTPSLPTPFKVSQQPPPSFVSSQQDLYKSGQQLSFASFPISSASQFQPQAGGTQPQKLPSQPVQSLPPGPVSKWIPGSTGPSVSFAMLPSQPVPQPLSQTPPPPTGSFSYPLHISYAVSSNNVVPRPPALFQDQYDPLADSFEPAPPGSLDRKKSEKGNMDQRRFAANSQSSLDTSVVKPQSISEHWTSNAGNISGSLMTNAGEVVLENVSPGLPGHMDKIDMVPRITRGSSPKAHPEVSIEDLSPTNPALSPQEQDTKLEGLQHHVMENVAPAVHDPVAEQSTADPVLKGDDEKKKQKEAKVLNLVRKAVAEQVKDLLKPTWKGGNMSKEAFKTIAKKAVDKVMGALESKGQIPKSSEKLDAFMKTSKPKIAKLVQGYIDKYVRA